MKRKIPIIIMITLLLLSITACNRNQAVELESESPTTTQGEDISAVESPDVESPGNETNADVGKDNEEQSIASDGNVSDDFLMQVEDVFSITGRGAIATGKVLTGTVWVGAEIELVGFSDEARTVKVESIEKFRQLPDSAKAGDSVGILLEGLKRQDVQRGQVLSSKGYISAHNIFTAKLKFNESISTVQNVLTAQCYFFTTDTEGQITFDKNGLDDEGYILAGIEVIQKLPMKVGTLFDVRQDGSVIASGEVTALDTGLVEVSALDTVLVNEEKAETKEKDDETSEVDSIVKVMLIDVGNRKADVVKKIREILDYGLKEAKELADYVPSVIKEGITLEEAELIKTELENLGATVRIEETGNL